MCGIIGYIGTKDAKRVLIEGLVDLEYRGYDSAGMKLAGQPVYKAVGPVKNLAETIADARTTTAGIAHTRWATHGIPAERNSHPHSGRKGVVWLVHNGIIENYQEIKKQLQNDGHVFKSETDSEVLAHLIEKNFLELRSLEQAVAVSLKAVTGAYGIVAYSDEEPDTLIAARMGSPLVIGIGENEHIIASDISPIVKHTKNIVYLDDGEIAFITKDSYQIKNHLSELIHKEAQGVEWNVETARKEGFEHFMLKEIFETPDVITNTVRGRITHGPELVKLGGLQDVADRLTTIENIYLIGCGSAYYAGLYGKYLFEELSEIPVTTDYASEFRYRKNTITDKTLVIAVSQSGETADTLEAMREAKKKGALAIGIVNVVGSTISRETDAGVYNHAGPEISVASTKAFISQMTVLVLLSIHLASIRGLSNPLFPELLKELEHIPDKIRMILKNTDAIQALAQKYKEHSDFLFIGRKYNFPIALEGALKLKEVSYIHAEGYGAGEMKHGPLAMIDENFPTVALAPKDSVYEKMVSNIQEIKARNGKIIAISDTDELGETDTIIVPQTLEPLSPILNLIPLQLLAYYVATAKGLNVDRPRNLAKSVTVE